MKKYNLSKIMKRAWRIKKEDNRNVFALCLKMAWEEEKAIGNKKVNLEADFRIVKNNDGFIRVKTPYIPALVSDLKAETKTRRWDSFNKVWTLSEEETDTVKRLMKKYENSYVVTEKEISEEETKIRFFVDGRMVSEDAEEVVEELKALSDKDFRNLVYIYNGKTIDIHFGVIKETRLEMRKNKNILIYKNMFFRNNVTIQQVEGLVWRLSEYPDDVLKSLRANNLFR
ncbi:MAG: hypothetical protein ACI4F9_00875 [Lachnospiraceae bacterium]